MTATAIFNIKDDALTVDELAYWPGEKYIKLNPKEMAQDLSKGLSLIGPKTESKNGRRFQ